MINMENEIKFTDSLKKFSRFVFLGFMIGVIASISAAMQGALNVKEPSIREIFIYYVIFPCFSLAVLYFAIFTFRYRITCDSKKIIVRSMFRTTEIEYKTIIKCRFDQYYATKYYTYILTFGHEKQRKAWIAVSSVHNDDFLNLIRENTDGVIPPPAD